ncbi:MAG: hypothetical protein HQK55_12085 [Deltaproteobacteria bacterium]|nr:hypothetical protein [Deltaproteobacteria bacterium]
MSILVSEQKSFVVLMKVAQEDPQIAQTLISLLKLQNIHRKSLLNSWILDLRLKKAPNDFIEALVCLTDDRVAGQALGLLEGKKFKREK